MLCRRVTNRYSVIVHRPGGNVRLTFYGANFPAWVERQDARLTQFHVNTQPMVCLLLAGHPGECMRLAPAEAMA